MNTNPQLPNLEESSKQALGFAVFKESLSYYKFIWSTIALIITVGTILLGYSNYNLNVKISQLEGDAKKLGDSLQVINTKFNEINSKRTELDLLIKRVTSQAEKFKETADKLNQTSLNNLLEIHKETSLFSQKIIDDNTQNIINQSSHIQKIAEDAYRTSERVTSASMELTELKHKLESKIEEVNQAINSPKTQALQAKIYNLETKIDCQLYTIPDEVKVKISNLNPNLWIELSDIENKELPYEITLFYPNKNNKHKVFVGSFEKEIFILNERPYSFQIHLASFADGKDDYAEIEFCPI